MYMTGVSCGSPEDVINGNHSGGHLFGDKVNYYCYAGYHMTSGDRQRACQSNKTWSGQLPSCSSKSVT